MQVLGILTSKTSVSSNSGVRRTVRRFVENSSAIQKTFIANYTTAAEKKLNDIYLKYKSSGRPTDAIEHNIDQFERLPDSIKKGIRPTDITIYGSVDQNAVDRLWEAGKKARKAEVIGRPPVFRASAEEEALAAGTEEVFNTTSPDDLPGYDPNIVSGMDDLDVLTGDSGDFDGSAGSDGSLLDILGDILGSFG